jgi:hypothetical protein
MVDPSEVVGDLSAVGQLLVSVAFLYLFLTVIQLVANALEAAPIGFSTPLDDVAEATTAPVDDGLAWLGDQLGGFK